MCSEIEKGNLYERENEEGWEFIVVLFGRERGGIFIAAMVDAATIPRFLLSLDLT